MKCEFSLQHYFDTLEKAQELGYEIKTVSGSEKMSKRANIILRHDIDFSPKYAFGMALKEYQKDITSTYYVLLRDDYYNPLSKRNIPILKQMVDFGHEIGLHYDSRFTTTNTKLKNEITILEDIIDTKITSIAAHVPNEIKRLTGKDYLEDEIDLEKLNLIESKHNTLNAKYISDSGRNWREGCMCEHIGKHKNEHGGLRDIQILTHPIWWNNNELSIKSELELFKENYIGDFDGYIEEYKHQVQRLMDRENKPKESYEIW